MLLPCPLMYFPIELGQNNPNRIANTDILLLAVDIAWKDDEYIACKELNDKDCSKPGWKK